MCVAIPEKSSYDEVVAALDALFKKAHRYSLLLLH